MGLVSLVDSAHVPPVIGHFGFGDRQEGADDLIALPSYVELLAGQALLRLVLVDAIPRNVAARVGQLDFSDERLAVESGRLIKRYVLVLWPVR